MLKMSNDLYEDNIVVDYLLNNNLSEIVFNEGGDLWNGLTFCVDNVWAFDIYIDSYTCIGNAYYGTFTVNMYDHFGLDTSDLNRYGYHPGFKSWYILQHYEAYDEAYKPFITVMSFSVDFSGTTEDY